MPRLHQNERQVYPKLVVDLETDLDQDAIDLVFDNFYDSAKNRIRALFAGDPQTRIKGWHFHLSTGAVDEVEPNARDS